MPNFSCPYCCADSDGYPLTQLEKMAGCNNCRIDLQSGGKWTGHAHPIIDSLVAKHGRQTIFLMALEAKLF